MIQLIWRSFVATVLLSVILCGIYPLAVTVVGQLLFSEKALGGIITLQNGRVVGARIIGQGFSRPGYFHGRPSFAGEKGYDASASSGSNLGPTNQKLSDAVRGNVEAVLKENPTLKRGQVPTDLVTGSASGLDPHISPGAALAQLDRVAQARHVTVEQVRALLREHVEGPQFWIFGEPVVNVLLLNLDLDRLIPLK